MKKPTPRRNYRRFRRIEEPYRVNRKITSPQVRIVGPDRSPEIYPISTALAMAAREGLDLIEISPKADPPVCTIRDYAKFKYEQKKKEKLTKAKAAKNIKKEIKLSLRIDEHDLAFKQKHAIKFIQEGAAVDIIIQFRGRELQDKTQGRIALEKFFEQIAPQGAVLKNPPKLVGRRYIMTIELDKKKKQP